MHTTVKVRDVALVKNVLLIQKNTSHITNATYIPCVLLLYTQIQRQMKRGTLILLMHNKDYKVIVLLRV